MTDSRGDPATLWEARALANELTCARGALRRYVRVVRHALRELDRVEDKLPF